MMTAATAVATVRRRPSRCWSSVAAAVAYVAVPSLLLLLSTPPVSPSIWSSLPSGNVLWDDLMGKCDGPRNTMDCVRSRLYNYVNSTFESDFNVTDGIRFTRNSNDYNAVCPGANETDGSFREARTREDDAENEVDDGWSDVTQELYDRGTKYLITHDFEATVPSFLGGGPDAKVRLSPKKILPDGGIILRMDVLPAEGEVRSSRSLHKMIKQLFKKKLFSSAMAMMLIVKLIKIKVMFLLPLLIGAGAAKKLLLKALLFLFPPLAHLFKLCSYYHHHASKYYHFHHHKVKHHHHHLKIPVPVPVPARPPPSYHSSGPDYYPAGPPQDHPPGPYDTAEYTGSGPPSDYYNRNSLDMNGVGSDNMDELASWGLGEYGDGSPPYEPLMGPKYTHTSSPSQYESVARPSGPPSQPSYLKRQDEQNNAINRAPLQPLLPSPQQHHVSRHDPVYSPIIQKLDDIFHELSVPEEPCKEKLVCRMYGNPNKFSPHSNLVSAQLSSETAASSAGGTTVDAARLWRYVQAAKEGQNGEDCRALYPNCGLIGL